MFCLLALIGSFFAMSSYIYYMSRFLDTIGPQELPLITIGSAALIMIYSLINTFANRMHTAYVYVSLLLFLAGVCLLLGSGPSGMLQVSALFLISYTLLSFFDISIVNMASSIVSPLQAKSLLPYVSAFSSLGIILASSSISQLKHFYEGFGIPFLMMGVLLLLVAINFIMIKAFKKDFLATVLAKKEEKNSGAKEVKETPWEKMKDTFVYIKNYRLFRVLAIVTVMMTAVQIASEFKVKTVLAINYTGDDLTSMLGLVYFIDSAGSFLINLFVAKKLLFYFGVGNLLMFYPLWIGLMLLIAIAAGLGPIPVIIYFVSLAIPAYSFVPISISQIYSIAPRQYSNSIYFFIRGILSALSLIVISGVLMVYSLDISKEQYLNTIMIALLIIILAYAIYRMRRYYLRELRDHLSDKDDYLKTRAIELFAEKTHKEQGEIYLRNLLFDTNTSQETRIKVMHSLAIIGNYQTISDLIQVLATGSIREKYAALRSINAIIKGKCELNKFPVSKHILLEEYERLFISDVPLYLKLEIISSLKHFDLDDVIDFLEKSLQFPDPEVRVNTIETLGTYHDRSIIIFLKPYLADSNSRVVCAVIAALWQFKDMRIHLINDFAKILADESTEGISNAMFLVNSLNASWEKSYVKNKVTSESTHVRLYALLTLLRFREESYVRHFVLEWTKVLMEEKEINGVMANMCKIKYDDRAVMQNSAETNFVLSQYARLKPKIKSMIIRQIQSLPPEKASCFLEVFKKSTYDFFQEIQELS